MVGPTYAEHAAAWARGGHAVAAVADLRDIGEADVAVVVTPNNPDGRVVPVSELAAAAAGLAARGGWLVVDEAFADLEPVESLCGAVPPACLVLRSFGKTYGLAGLRLGFAVAGEPLVGLLRRGIGPWAVSGPAIAVGRCALADAAWRHEAVAARGRDAARLDALLERAGGRIVGGTRLFRTADFPDGPGLFDRLGRAGIFVRRFEAAPARLRFGLPPDAQAWSRLAAAPSLVSVSSSCLICWLVAVRLARMVWIERDFSSRPEPRSTWRSFSDLILSLRRESSVVIVASADFAGSMMPQRLRNSRKARWALRSRSSVAARSSLLCLSMSCWARDEIALISASARATTCWPIARASSGVKARTVRVITPEIRSIWTWTRLRQYFSSSSIGLSPE